MQLSVVILNYKVPYYLLQCIASVKKAIATLAAEIIVVDNASNDESCSLVEQYFPEVILVKNPYNNGFSKGNNLGIAQARGKYLCLLNPDTVVAENTFVNALQFADAHADLGALGVKLIDGAGGFLPESKRNLPTPKVALKKLLGIGNDYYAPLPENTQGKVAVLVGAFMLMKTERYHEVGKLDEDYFMYGEDIDLSYKFLKYGYQNYYLGETLTLHYKGESTAKNAVYRKRFFDAMRTFYQKHYQQSKWTTHFVHVGLRAAKYLHSVKQEASAVTGKDKPVLIISRDSHSTLIPRFSAQQLHPQEASQKKIENKWLIFDADSVEYHEIFSIMEQQKNQGNHFRIKPPNFNFIIGSDSRTGLGDVIKI